MKGSDVMGAEKLEVTDDFVIESVSKKISSITGVQLGEKQKTMVSTRLSRRLREVGADSLAGYWSYLQESEAQEIPHLISLLTTHHTFFFREFVQLERLLQRLPERPLW